MSVKFPYSPNSPFFRYSFSLFLSVRTLICKASDVFILLPSNSFKVFRINAFSVSRIVIGLSGISYRFVDVCVSCVSDESKVHRLPQVFVSTCMPSYPSSIAERSKSKPSRMACPQVQRTSTAPTIPLFFIT